MSVVLRVISGPHTGREYLFHRHATFTVGRSSQVDFPVPDDPFLSRDHFLIEFNPPVCHLKDMGSTNGTRVNGKRVAEVRLGDGDVISAGKSSFEIRVDDTREQHGTIRCLACRRQATPDVAVAAGPGDSGAIRWVCERCASRRRLYPAPPEGYWIDERIGAGGMGDVFRGRHLASGRVVALKMLIPAAAASARAQERFRREMEVLKDLRHPHIVAFHEMIADLGQFCLVMEYVDGPNARDWMTRLGGLPPVAAVARIGVQLLAALDHAHRKGYVHRDIKPSNLIVAGPPERPDVKLSDFGLAKNFRDDAGFAGLTHQGDVGGSVGFLSPDHIRDFREVKEPADLYGVAATLYYLLSGKFPYFDFDPERTDAYAMILEHPTVPLRVHRPDVPEALDALIRKGLEKQPRDRPRSAASMLRALEPFASPGGGDSPGSGSSPAP